MQQSKRLRVTNSNQKLSNKKPTSEKLLNWLQSVDCTDAVVKQFDDLRKEEEKRHKNRLEYKEKLEALTIINVMSDILNAIVSITADKKENQLLLLYSTRRKPVEIPWIERAGVIFFYLHPHMANKDLQVTSDAFGGIPKETIRCWLHRANMIPKWIPYLENMKASDVIELLPYEIRSYFYFIPSNSTVDLSQYVLRSQYATTRREIRRRKLTTSPFIHSFSCSCSLPHSSSACASSSINPPTSCSSFLLPSSFSLFPSSSSSTSSKRISSNKKLGRRTAYPKEREFIIQLICSQWDLGEPLTKPELQKAIEFCPKFRSGDSMFFKNILNPLSKCFPNSLHQFLSRTLKNAKFTVRNKFIVKTVPENWRTIAQERTTLIKKKFKEEGIQVLIALDELFIKFPSLASSFSYNNSITSPSNISFPNLQEQEHKYQNEFDSILLLLSLERLSSQLLSPFLLVTRTTKKEKQEQEEQELLRTWSSFEYGNIHVVKECKMTSELLIEYFELILKAFPNKIIGILLDVESQHATEQVLDWIKKTKEQKKGNIVLAYMEGELTPVCHPPSLSILKLFKQKLIFKFNELKEQSKKLSTKEPFHHIREANFSLKEQTNTSKDSNINFFPFRISKKKMTELVLECCIEINSLNRNVRSISKAFEIAGVDPWIQDVELFTGNLNSLSTNLIYENMLNNQTALKLL